MASTYSALKIELMTTGEEDTTWGAVTNVNLGTAIEEAIAGTGAVTYASAEATVSLTDTNDTQVARHMRLDLGGTSGGAQNLVVPTIEKLYIINNGTADAITVKTSAGTGIAVPTGKTMWVYADGTNVVDVTTHLTSLTLGSALPVASGGTNATSASITAFNNITGYTASGATGTTSTNLVFSTSPTLITPTLGVASATTVNKVTLTTPATGSTLTIADGKTLTASKTMQLTAADDTGVYTFPTGTNTLLASGGDLGTPSAGVLSSCTEATDSAAGVTEHATTAEIDTSTATNRSMTPGAFSDSLYGIRYVPVSVFGPATDCTTGNGKAFFHIPPGLNGFDLMYVHAEVGTAGTTNSMTVMVRKNAVDMLSTIITLATTETGSDQTSSHAIKTDGSEAVATNDVVWIDVDAVHDTPAKGLVVTLGFRIP